MILIVSRRGRHRHEDEGVLWGVLLIPLAIMLAAPYVWWVRARDSGLSRWSAATETTATAVLPWVLGYRFGWWLVPLVLLVEGLVGLVAIDMSARAELRRERRERDEEERDWRYAN